MTKNKKTLLGQLKKKKRAELLFVMEQLLERKPDIIPLIELLIELPSSSTHQQGKPSENGNKRKIDLPNIQHQVITIVNKASRRGREAVYWAVEELERLCEIGDSFADAGQWADAQAVYAIIAEETITNYEGLEDECQIAEIIDGCAHGMALCLDTQRDLLENEQLDASSRKELLASLFKVWQFERNYGGITVDVTDVIVRNTLYDERKMLEEWIQQKISPDPADKWSNQSILNFLAVLAEKTHSSQEQ
jgi:hypothetical protein